MSFMERWFQGFGEGLEKMSREERGRLFQGCASMCGKDALKYLYADLFAECEGNLDCFFGRLHELKKVDGVVVIPGKEYEIHFLSCDCDLHTKMNVNTPKLCECSRQSITYWLGQLLPEEKFLVEEIDTILGGNEKCRFQITKKERMYGQL